MTARPSRLARVHARLLQALVPTLDAADAADAARALDDRLAESRRRSRAAWLRAALAEAAALARTAVAERRDLRRRRRGPATPASPWAGAPARLPSPARRVSIPAAFGQVWRDARHGARQLARAPLFTAVAVLSLAFGMAAAIAVFSVANALFWQPPPHVQDPGALVRLAYGERDVGSAWSYLDFEDVRRTTPALSGAAAYGADTVVVAQPDGARRETVAVKVSPGYFGLLGVRMALGRGFLASDLDAGGAVVLGQGFWRREFGGDPRVLGRPVEVNGQTRTVVGVAPAGLRMIAVPVEPDLWTLVPRDEREQRGWHGLFVVGRLAPGATLAMLDTQLAGAARRLFDDLPPTQRQAWGAMPEIRAVSEREARVPLGDRGVVLAGFGGVLAVVLLLLAVAASNVANMMLTRASERQAEIGMRLALGATRRRVTAQLLVESGVVAAAAGALGLLTVDWGFRALAAAPLGLGLPASVVIDTDLRVALFAAGLALATGLFFGLAPALHATKADLVSAIKGVRPLARHGLRRIIVTAQVAGSLVLVVSSLLFLRSLQAALHTAVGFDPDGVIAVPIDLTQRHYAADAAARFYEALEARVGALAGVERLAFARALPLGGTNIREGALEIEGHAPPAGDQPSAALNMVSPGYFALLRVPLVAGRDFTAADRAGAPPVAIVNQAFAARYWPGQAALGKRIGTRTVVGVARDASYVSIGEAPLAHLWTPLAQTPDARLTLLVRSPLGTAIAPRLEAAVHDLDKALLVRARPMREVTANATLPLEILSAALGAAALVALALATMGVYGVMAYVVSLRGKEMGIRIALGADPAALAGMVVKEGLALASAGIVLGLAGAAGLAHLARALLVGVGPLDPVAIGGGAALLVLAAAAASYLPARRAARIDPIVSLRAE